MSTLALGFLLFFENKSNKSTENYKSLSKIGRGTVLYKTDPLSIFAYISLNPHQNKVNPYLVLFYGFI
jgi:hypothetical protein